MGLSSRNESSVLPENFSKGPLGLGDPEDQTLRKVETEVLIPKKMRDIAHKQKCTEEVSEFSKCCKGSSFLMVALCRKENKILRDCLSKWYNDQDFRKVCTEEYLQERAEYRSTGIKKMDKLERLPSNS